MQTNDDGERVYRPDYTKLDRIVIHMISHERTRTASNPSLRTDDGDKECAPRTRKTEGIAEDRGEDGAPLATKPQRQPLLRSVLTCLLRRR